MTEEKIKKRGWVKNAAIIFLSVMLVLTFFSNTIMNWSLSEVAVKTVQNGTITAQIRGTGTITAAETFEVKVDDTRKVMTVYAKEGQEVSTGDILFVLNDGGSEELTSAKEILEELQKSYQRQLIQATTYDYSRDNREIEKLRMAVEDAIAARDAIVINEEEYAAKKEAAAAAETALKEAQAAVDAFAERREASDDLMYELNDAVKEAQKALDARNDEVTRIENEMRSLTIGSGESTSLDSAEAALSEANADLKSAKEELAAANKALDAAWMLYGNDYNTLVDDAETAIIAYYDSTHADGEKWADLPAAKQDEIKSGMLESYIDTTADAYKKISGFKADVAAAERSVNNAQKAVDAASDVYDSAYSVYYEQNKDNSAYRKLKKQLDAAKEEQASAQLVVNEKNAAVEAEERNRELEDRAKSKAEKFVSEKEKELNRAQAEVDAIDKKKDDRKLAQNEVEMAEEDLDNALFNLSQQKKSDSVSQQIQELDFSDMRSQIEEQKELIERLESGSAGTEIKAELNGVVKNVGISSGNTTQPGAVMCTIEVPDRGYYAQIQVTADQAQKVSLGDEGSISTGWWGKSNMSARLTAIRPDPQNPRTNKYLVFEVTGDNVNSGDSVTISIGERSRNYDTVVPKSAMRSDSNGDFVLMVTAKSSPLGNRYIAQRIDVKKLAEDDMNCAVSGGLAYGDYVITTATAPVESGMQVRMAEG